MTTLTNPPSSPASLAGLTRSMHGHWRLFLTEGFLLGVLGLAAVVAPFLAGLVAAAFFGWLFLISGLVGLVFTLRAREAPGFAWSLLSAILALVAGAVLLWSPLAGLATLTVVLTAFFVVDGIFMIVLALTHRRALSARWGWLLANGLIDLFLAGVIIAGLPGTLLWAFGLVVGIDLVFGGATLVNMALAARKAPRG
jgi:uncharacterized membrane protein HdeD (DUF308 family)